VAAREGESREHEDGVAVGTPLYMAPETLEGDPPDRRADLYAVGLVLYRAISGVMPWEGATPRAAVYKRLTVHPRPLQDAYPPVRDPIARVIMRALERDPDHRFQTAREMREALEDALDPTTAAPVQRAVGPR
jgi:serine/threonine-protein kinase